jgi:hypothetical protein
MKTRFVKLVLLVATALASGACSDTADVGAAQLEPVNTGMPKDSVLALLGKGPLTAKFADTLRVTNGFRSSTYLLNGKTYDVLFYREEAGDVSEPVQQDRETPIVLENGKVLGWGWRFYVEEAMKSHGLPSPITAAPAPAAAPQVTPVDSAPQRDTTSKA